MVVNKEAELKVIAAHDKPKQPTQDARQAVVEGYNRRRIVTRCRSFKGSLRHSAPSGHCTLQTARLYSTMQYRKFKSENLCLLRWIHHVRVVNGKGGVYYVRADNSHRFNRLRSICRRHQNDPRVLHKDSRSLSYQPIDRRSSLSVSVSNPVGSPSAPRTPHHFR